MRNVALALVTLAVVFGMAMYMVPRRPQAYDPRVSGRWVATDAADMRFEFSPDGKGFSTFGQWVTPFEWSTNGNTITIVQFDEEGHPEYRSGALEFSGEGKVLTLPKEAPIAQIRRLRRL